ncbi:hypothetical protein ACFS5J_05735 [Flavobacterium chuncheonense]|uniref:Uncharacterized protein n=1 Tax=Flavobacterium chuncheonense TaxID=2026653 RepID=A0ABW5YKJ1_9FLAO
MRNEIQTPTVQQQKATKRNKLILSILFDAIGMVSYLIPVVAETIDVVWAPIAGLLLVTMYKGTKGKVAGIIGFIEEIIPGLDFIPTFTLTWIYTYLISKENNN